MSSSSKFDLSAFKSILTNKESYKELARTCEAAERYEDMCVVMKALVENVGAVELDTEERNLLSVAYKNVIGSRRASWRTLHSDISEMELAGNVDKPFLLEYERQVEAELQTTCEEVISLLATLEPNAKGVEEKVFYLKMRGDYYRYLAESITSNATYGDEAANYYGKAHELAKEGLAETHPIRLGLALNYSVCYYEILKQPTQACELAKTAFDDAISKLDKLEESDYKDSTLIMQLLRDNLTLWTANNDDEDVEVHDLE